MTTIDIPIGSILKPEAVAVTHAVHLVKDDRLEEWTRSLGSGLHHTPDKDVDSVHTVVTLK